MTFIGHLSDTHLGHEAYSKLTATGHNQRGVDIVQAFRRTVKDIVEMDPPLVIHSGDAGDTPRNDTNYLLVLQTQLTELASIRPDGTRRQVVIISGNHDQPRDKTEVCFLELFSGIPGVHVVTDKYDVIAFDGTGPSENCSKELYDIDVHAIPHDQLKVIDFETVQPTPNKRSILTSHGVAGGSDLFYRSLGREYAIPTDVLGRAWSYVALGHWHKQGPVPLVSTGGKVGKDVGLVWYAGSTENMSFSDLKENGTKRGWLLVELTKELPNVERRYVKIRNMFRLPAFNATGLTPEEITAGLIKRIVEGNVDKAIVGQIVENVSMDIWSLVDMQAVRKTAEATAMHYEVAVKYIRNQAATTDEERGMGDLPHVLSERASALFSETERKPALTMASAFLDEALSKKALNTEEKR